MTMHGDPLVEEALASRAFASIQHEIYSHLRDTDPVYWSPHLDAWLVTTFDLVDEVLTDSARYTSVGAETEHIRLLDPEARRQNPTIEQHFRVHQLNIADPPDHTRIRRAFGRSFVPRQIEKYQATIREAADRLLETALASDDLDLVADFTEPLPVEVVSEIMGIPREWRTDIPSVTLDQRYFFGENPPRASRAQSFDSSLRQWSGVLASLIEQRRQTPSDDVLSRAAAAIDEGKVSVDEAIATCLHLVIAGNGTTTSLIGNTVFLLLSHTDQMQMVLEDPQLLPNAIEESLRFEAPLPRDRRIAAEDTELGGQVIRRGQRVISVLASANRDPSKFEAPDRFDVTREFTASQHAAFGRGIHFCLGAPVARLEAQVALRAFIERLPDARLAKGFVPEWHSITTHRGLVRLPIETTPAFA